MPTLCIRYTIDPNKLKEFKTYVEAEQIDYSTSNAGLRNTHAI